MTMLGRPHVLVTREGWYYLFVVLFIIGGSVLREVNLLVVLAGVMLAPVLFNWRLVARSMRKLDLRREMPQRCEAGQPIRVRLTIRNEMPAACWMLTAYDSVRRSQTWRRQLVEVWFPHIPGNSTETAAYRLVLTERGKYRIGPLRIVSRFPFGLIRATVFHSLRRHVIVWPRIGQLTERWRNMLHGDRMGAQHSHSRRGDNGEFYALRPFASGDSLRMIHWRSTAKAREPMVRQTERLELPEVALVIDPFLASDEAADLAKLELLLRIAATVVLDVCREAGGNVSVTFSGAPPRSWQAAPSRRFAEQMLDELAVVKGHAHSPSQAIHEACARSPSAIPIVISTRARPVDATQQPLPPTRWIDANNPEGAYVDSRPKAAARVLLRAIDSSSRENNDIGGSNKNGSLEPSGESPEVQHATD